MKIKTVSEVLLDSYGEKVYRLALSSGCSCPNRDGTVGYGGCSFCSDGGSGEFASSHASIEQQIEEAKMLISKKTDAKKYIAYFQSYSNTYGDPERLRKMYADTIERDEIVILDIGTRPDCLGPAMMELLADLRKVKPVWVELGMQTVHDRTAYRINRGYRLSEFEAAYHKLKEAGIEVIVHVILNLPGETEEDMLDTIRYLSRLEPVLDGIKIHMLQILKGTALYEEYIRAPFPVMSLEEYGALLIRCLKVLDPRTVIHRMTGDGPKNLLYEPQWSADKKKVLNTLNKMIREA